MDALRSCGVAAASLDSTLSPDVSAILYKRGIRLGKCLPQESRNVKDAMLNGSLKILYVAPERLNNETFMRQIARVKSKWLPFLFILT